MRVWGDGWTVKPKDRSHSAQYEHQLVVTETGCEVMTIRDEEICRRSTFADYGECVIDKIIR